MTANLQFLREKFAPQSSITTIAMSITILTWDRGCIPSFKLSVQSTIRLSMWPKAPLITRSGKMSTFEKTILQNPEITHYMMYSNIFSSTSLPSTSSFMTTAGGSLSSTAWGILGGRYENESSIFETHPPSLCNCPSDKICNAHNLQLTRGFVWGILKTSKISS